MKCVRVGRDIGRGVKVGNLGNQRFGTVIKSRNDDSETLVGPRQPADSIFGLSPERFDTILEGAIVGEDRRNLLGCGFFGPSIDARYSREADREGAVPAHKLRIVIICDGAVGEGESPIGNLDDALA